MSGVQPSQLPNPVPGQDEVAAFMASRTPKMPEMSQTPVTTDAASSAESEIAQFMQQRSAAPPVESSFPGEGYVRGAIQSLPAVGAMAGGAATALAGGIPTLGVGAAPGAVIGAAGGGIAGTALRDYLNNLIFNEGPQTREDQYRNLGVSAVEQATGQMAGGNVTKALQLAGPPTKAAMLKGVEIAAGGQVPAEFIEQYLKAPAMVKDLALRSGGNVPTAANMIREGTKAVVGSTLGELEKPALNVLAKRANPMSDMETGDAVKQLIRQNVDQRYGPFKQAYENLSAVSREVPLPDEARRKFGVGLTDWALKEFPQSSRSYALVNKYKHSFEASNTGAQFESVLGDLNDEITAAFRNGETKKGELLKEMRERATGFLEKRTTDLAMRIQSGKATPDEMGFLTELTRQRSITEMHPEKYAKAMANDFLAAKDKIRSDYAGFKSFMEDLSEQTRVKGKGTINFLSKLDEVPSEKLVAKMLDPKNARALRTMRAETPEVFQQVSDYGVKQIMKRSTVNGEFNLSKFHDEVMSLQPEIRNLMFSAEEMASLSGTVKNSRYVRLNQLIDKMDKGIINPDMDHNALIAAGRTGSKQARDLGELSHLTGQNLVRDAQALAIMDSFDGSKISRKELLRLGLNAGNLAKDFVRGQVSQAPLQQYGPALGTATKQAVGNTMEQTRKAVKRRMDGE